MTVDDSNWTAYQVIINPLHSKGNFSGQVNQSSRYVHSCLELVILIEMGWVQTTLVGSRWFLNSNELKQHI